MFNTNKDGIWTLLLKKLAGETTKKDLLKLKEIERWNPQIYYLAETILKWWFLEKVREQTNSEIEKTIDHRRPTADRRTVGLS